MKRTQQEVSDHQARVAKLNRSYLWNLSQAERLNAQANRKSAKGHEGAASFLKLKASTHTVTAEELEKEIKRIKREFESPGVFTRLKRFLFNK